MSWDRLRELGAGGHEIGFHSMSHAILTRCDDAALRRQVSEPRRVLESFA